ncbi:aldose 1-epimerase family protein [Flavobacterium polysaccharolyticum]|uniref:Aldose 1-epimerase family protein n=1 Tax=Flavobacterium polysaccharolyticum TaxID=3133148 RepID=A0ABU9NN84_9FLAO
MSTISINNDQITAQFKTLGAELFSLKDKNNKEFIWEGNPNFWGKHSPILFPIVGSLKNNTFEYNDNSYSLPRHGFARELTFEVIDKKEDSVTFSLQSNEETQKKYPFSFELQLSYTLIGRSLHLGYKVINTSNTVLPFSIGGHPAFALPKAFDSYQLQFDGLDSLTFNLLEEGLISDQTKTIEIPNQQLNLEYQLFENDALVFKNISSKSVTILEENQPILKVDYSDFPDLGVWTPVNAPFICIEPWFGYSDTPNNSGKILEKEGIQLVTPKTFFESNYTITLL